MTVKFEEVFPVIPDVGPVNVYEVATAVAVYEILEGSVRVGELVVLSVLAPTEVGV